MSGSCDFPRLSVNVFLQFELVIQFCISIPRPNLRLPDSSLLCFKFRKPACSNRFTFYSGRTGHRCARTVSLCGAHHYLCVLPLGVAQCLPACPGRGLRVRHMNFWEDLL